ncbi:universal stress protein [Pseudomonas citronellolis]|uniref:universal stress protein n=1 Tax=Pseudomonas citronellolis TaxID=53408 RepID=UPI0023E38A27|nr:universal stress protein [Pseudomonas citronellolis]MDF3933679.1 universal stress protein [Pseudomonas citronellolis]
MNAYARLLLICDPDLHYSPAMARAQALAGSSGARLHIAVLGGLPVGLGFLDYNTRQRVRDEIQERQRSWLDDQLELLRGHGIDASAEAIWSEEPLDDIIRLVNTHRIDLLVKDTHYEPALRRALVHPLDWQLLRQCPVPLHLVSLATHPLPRKVAAAIDLSQDAPEVNALNERIVGLAQQFAEQCDAELHLLQAYDESASFLAYAASPVAWTPELADLAEGRSRQRMERIAAHFGVEPACQHRIKGPATRVIAEFAAQQHIDVVVLGTLYHTGLAKIIGSTTEQALYRVDSSILAVRP